MLLKKMLNVIKIYSLYIWKPLKKTNLTFWIFVSMIVGLLLGWLAPSFSSQLNIISNAFLKMIKCLITPLIFSTLSVGIAGHGGDVKKIGMLALKSIIYFEFATTIALIIGLISGNVAKPGSGIDLEAVIHDQGQTDQLLEHSKHFVWYKEFVEIIPSSFFEAAAKNEILQIVFCAIMFSIAMMHVEIKFKQPMLTFLESLSQIMFKVTELVMKFSPLGIGCALASTIGKSGIGILGNLGKLILTLYVSLLVYAIVLFVPVLLFCKVSLKKTLAHIYEASIIAFTTTSSEAALPKAMENMELLGVPKSIVAFVIPTGYSFNLDGTTLYLAIAALFCAQAGKINMPLGEQIIMMITLMLTSKGVAAVPRASLVILSGTVSSFNLPIEAVGLILGVDAIMDMGRTTINLTGNCIACIVVAVWEKSFEYNKQNHVNLEHVVDEGVEHRKEIESNKEIS